MPTKSSSKSNSGSESNSDSTTESENTSYISSSSDEYYNQADNLDLAGKLLNKYNIISKIGNGADAIVWLAYNMDDSKYYAIKVNEPNEYKKGSEEFRFLKKLPEKLPVFNHLKESFVEQNGNKKYACGVFELQTGNLDALLRKSKLDDGLPVKIVRKIMYQVLIALKHMHQKLKVYHADLKTDNILLKGINNFDKEVIRQYNEMNFGEIYKKTKESYWIDKGKTLDTIDKMKSENKKEIREKIHQIFCEKIIFPEKDEKYNIDSKYLETCNVTVSDFGTFCREEEQFDGSFGTRYYRAPEVILRSECSYGVDIWAMGCIFYELLTGRLLFDPEKDSKHSRDEYHLYWIQNFCGKYPTSFLKKTKMWKKYFNAEGDMLTMKYKSKDFKEVLEMYNVNEDLDKVVSLLKGMLDISPKHRFDIDACLSHPFFLK
jgi:serine/threonine protein kinase